MAIPPWILESPLKAGIQTMEAGGRLGLAARSEDLRQAAQQDAAAEASDRAQLSLQEMQQRRESAAARLAESLRAQTALEQYRQSEVANQAALREQAKASAAAMLLRQGQQQQNWTADHALRAAAEKRLEDRDDEAADFTPASPIVIKHPVTGEDVGLLQQESPQTWRMVKPQPNAEKVLSPAQAGAQLYNRAKIIEFEMKDATDEEKPLLRQELGFIKTKLKGSAGQIHKPTPLPTTLQRLTWNSQKGDFE